MLKKLFIISLILVGLFIYSCTKMMIQKKEVVITIDDMPAFPNNTFKMLEVLKKHNVNNAVCFLIGYYTEIDTSHLADSIAKYEMIGNHTYSHPSLAEKSLSEQYENEIEYNQIIIDGLNMKYNKPLNKYFRPPYSSITDKQQDTLSGYGYDIIWWDQDASDWNPNISVKEIFDYHITHLNNSLKDKNVLLFHLGDNSIKALDSLLYYFEETNIKIVNL
jgi:peptidoglycan-N-acetylglucosamine deacetylase